MLVRSRAYQSLGRKEEALGDLSRALTLDTQNETVIHMIEELQGG